MKNLLPYLTKYFRARKVLKYLQKEKSHLDLGSGDNYLLKKSPCKIKKGLDKINGVELKKKIPLNQNFDYITMLAFIEHLDYPNEIIKDCKRLLNPNGKLIITTPTKLGNRLMSLYHFGDEKHKIIFDKKKVINLLKPYFKNIMYKKFEFRLNQLIIAEK